MKMQLKKIKLNYARKIFKRNWSFSQWLVYSSLLQWGTGNLFIIMAGTLLGPWAVGVIRIMQNTMGLFNVLFIFLENVLPINFANIFKILSATLGAFFVSVLCVYLKIKKDDFEP